MKWQTLITPLYLTGVTMFYNWEMFDTTKIKQGHSFFVYIWSQSLYILLHIFFRIKVLLK